MVLGQMTSGTGSVYNAPLLRLCVDHPEVSLHGHNCPGTGGTAPLLGITGVPTPGAQPTFWLSNAPPNGIAIAAYGFDNEPPFPVNLTPFGATGCVQYFPLVLLEPVLTNGLGIGQHALPLSSSPSVVGNIILGQYFVLDPGANALGITASNAHDAVAAPHPAGDWRPTGRQAFMTPRRLRERLPPRARRVGTVCGSCEPT
jgi:hypothetical protein